MRFHIPIRLLQLFLSCLVSGEAFLASPEQRPIRSRSPLSSRPSHDTLASLGAHCSGKHHCGDDENLNSIAGYKRRRFLLATIGTSVINSCLLFSVQASKAADGQRQPGIPLNNKRIGGLANKIQVVSRVMDELQRDLMQERWDLIEAYAPQLRSYIPVFTAYTDSAFPSDAPTDNGLRVALRYEVGRLFASLERFRQAVSRKSLNEAYLAYSEMSLHLDRYLRVGGLYSFYDTTIDNEPYFKGISDDTLVYADPKKDPPLVRDLVVLVKGPDKGKTGIVIGMYQDGTEKSAIKLDRYKGMREIRVVPNAWVAKRLGEQDPDDVFLIPRKGG